ncbi:MAG: glyceraldehyde 3-phosphate dehydrogenase NAD-binding domain-containing protein [Nitrosomonadales bacterium]|nr:glyceraldehyde 3-phosphate dehydrogenase NAD-binding domain-containing protein [Nitrosomonadales bacterium]
MKNLRVGIAGLGRIGRGILRANHTKHAGGRFDVCVVCDVMPIDQVAYLLAHDSTYGKPTFSVDYIDQDLILGGKRVRYVRVDRRRRPSEDSFGMLREFDLDVFIDATGTASIDDLRAVLDKKVAKKILCTANIAGCDLSMVYGVNDHLYDPQKHFIMTSNTCTGNAMAPVAHVLDKNIGIDYARIITLHPALSDQRALDGYHAIPQLGRACAASIIPTGTQVANSTVMALPALAGKLDSISYRVPTEIVSTIDVTATLSRETSLEECIDLFTEYARNELAGIIHCDFGAWGYERTSIDYLGTQYSAILLMKHLTVMNGRQLGLSLMHDNEVAYCHRVLDVLGVLNGKKSHKKSGLRNEMPRNGVQKPAMALHL